MRVPFFDFSCSTLHFCDFFPFFSVFFFFFFWSLVLLSVTVTSLRLYIFSLSLLFVSVSFTSSSGVVIVSKMEWILLIKMQNDLKKDEWNVRAFCQNGFESKATIKSNQMFVKWKKIERRHLTLSFFHFIFYENVIVSFISRNRSLTWRDCHRFFLSLASRLK